jgi:glycosyltransferase involved in cell wall biosynthesis
MKVVLVSEVYAPRAGGAGWSARALALGLRGAGHDVRIVTTSPGPEDLDGLAVTRLHLDPEARKRIAVPRAFAAQLEKLEWDVVHAQHSLAAMSALRGRWARRTVVTVRDHWPVCFWSTRISQGALCPGCGVGPMTRCVKGHVTWRGPLAWAAIPYMQGDLFLKRRALRQAGAVLAVSEAIAVELRAARLPVEVVPNVVDAQETRIIGAGPPSLELPEEFLLFIGKLEENKGGRALIPAVAAAKTGLPLVILGEGSLAHSIKFEAQAAGVPVQLRGWAHRDDVLRAMARATVLVFPSLWPEPLSRVLLEALALGTPVAAMATGGTREILVDGQSGLVVNDQAGLPDAVARLCSDTALRKRISEGARERAHDFSPEVLIPRYESIYRRLA